MAFNRRPAAATTVSKATNDMTLPADAQDTISSISWSPAANHLAAASWDGKVRIYDIAADGSSRGAAILSAEGPLFDCDWAKDGSMVLAGGADRKAHLLHLATNQQISVGSHDAPIRGVRFVDIPGSNGPIFATGSWDKTVKFWDIRQQNPLGSIACSERVYSMDAQARLLVVATAERQIHLVDLQNPTTITRTKESPLKHQTRSVGAAPDGKVFGIAGIEGRCGISAVDEKDTSTNFTFRCHRDAPDSQNVTKVWGVNAIRFHPTIPTTFVTAGADGSFNFWDRVAHSRLKGYEPVGGAITDCAFNRDGSLFAYAVGYDWSMGFSKNTPQYLNKLCLHAVAEEDFKPKRK